MTITRTSSPKELHSAAADSLQKLHGVATETPKQTSGSETTLDHIAYATAKAVTDTIASEVLQGVPDIAAKVLQALPNQEQREACYQTLPKRDDSIPAYLTAADVGIERGITREDARACDKVVFGVLERVADPVKSMGEIIGLTKDFFPQEGTIYACLQVFHDKYQDDPQKLLGVSLACLARQYAHIMDAQRQQSIDPMDNPDIYHAMAVLPGQAAQWTKETFKEGCDLYRKGIEHREDVNRAQAQAYVKNILDGLEYINHLVSRDYGKATELGVGTSASIDILASAHIETTDPVIGLVDQHLRDDGKNPDILKGGVTTQKEQAQVFSETPKASEKDKHDFCAKTKASVEEHLPSQEKMVARPAPLKTSSIFDDAEIKVSQVTLSEAQNFAREIREFQEFGWPRQRVDEERKLRGYKVQHRQDKLDRQGVSLETQLGLQLGKVKAAKAALISAQSKPHQEHKVSEARVVLQVETAYLRRIIGSLAEKTSLSSSQLLDLGSIDKAIEDVEGRMKKATEEIKRATKRADRYQDKPRKIAQKFLHAVGTARHPNTVSEEEKTLVEANKLEIDRLQKQKEMLLDLKKILLEDSTKSTDIELEELSSGGEGHETKGQTEVTGAGPKPLPPGGKGDETNGQTEITGAGPKQSPSDRDGFQKVPEKEVLPEKLPDIQQDPKSSSYGLDQGSSIPGVQGFSSTPHAEPKTRASILGNHDFSPIHFRVNGLEAMGLRAPRASSLPKKTFDLAERLPKVGADIKQFREEWESYNDVLPIPVTRSKAEVDALNERLFKSGGSSVGYYWYDDRRNVGMFQYDPRQPYRDASALAALGALTLFFKAAEWVGDHVLKPLAEKVATATFVIIKKGVRRAHEVYTGKDEFHKEKVEAHERAVEALDDVVNRVRPYSMGILSQIRADWFTGEIRANIENILKLVKEREELLEAIVKLHEKEDKLQKDKTEDTNAYRVVFHEQLTTDTYSLTVTCLEKTKKILTDMGEIEKKIQELVTSINAAFDKKHRKDRVQVLLPQIVEHSVVKNVLYERGLRDLQGNGQGVHSDSLGFQVLIRIYLQELFEAFSTKEIEDELSETTYGETFLREFREKYNEMLVAERAALDSQVEHDTYNFLSRTLFVMFQDLPKTRREALQKSFEPLASLLRGLHVRLLLSSFREIDEKDLLQRPKKNLRLLFEGKHVENQGLQSEACGLLPVATRKPIYPGEKRWLDMGLPQQFLYGECSDIEAILTRLVHYEATKPPTQSEKEADLSWLEECQKRASISLVSPYYPPHLLVFDPRGEKSSALCDLQSHFRGAAVKGDGHCLFRSLAAGIMQRGGFDMLKEALLANISRPTESQVALVVDSCRLLEKQEKSAHELVNDKNISDAWVYVLRRCAASWWTAQSLEAQDRLVESLGFHARTPEEKREAIDTYLKDIERMKKDVLFGGEPEFMALANVLMRPIVIVDVEETLKVEKLSCVIINRTNRENSLFASARDLRGSLPRDALFLLFEKNHYNLLI